MRFYTPRNKFIYPAGYAPGFDPTHILAPNPLVSLITVGRGIVNLLNGHAVNLFGTTSSGFKLDSLIGPSFSFAAGTSGCTFPMSTTIPSSLTMAFFYRPIANLAFATLLVTDSNNAVGVLVYNNSGSFQLAYNNVGNISSGIPLVINNPYFLMVSFINGGTVNFLALNLRTSSMVTATKAGNTATLTGSSGSWQMGNGDNQADGALPMMMASAAYYPLSTLIKVADDPWSFWFPYLNDESYDTDIGGFRSQSTYGFNQSMLGF